MANSLAVWRNYLNQRYLTTGVAPTPEELQALKMAELEEAYSQKYKSRQLALQERSIANAETATANQYNLGLQQLSTSRDIAEEQAQAQKQASLISTGIQAPLSGAAVYGLGKQLGWWEKTPATTATAATTIPTSTVENIPSINPTDMWAPTDTTYAAPVVDTTGTLPTELSYAYEAAPSIGATAPAAATATGTTAADAIAGTWAGAEVPAYEAGTNYGTTAASSMIPYWVPYVGYAMAGRDILGQVVPALGGPEIGGWQSDVRRGTNVLEDTFDSAGNFIGTSLWGGMGGMLGTEKAFQDIGNDVWDTATGWVSDAADWVSDPGGGCIIVTCCHGRNSEEVDIARRFRDNHMTPEETRGYYMIADKIVPLMEENPDLKELVKTMLVDKLIPYGRCALGETKRCSKESQEVTGKFLDYCESVGKTVDSYTRSNGEVV